MVKLMAMAWLREEDWPRWSEIDGAMCSFEQWSKKMDRLAAEVKAAGLAPVKVPVDPDAFVSWCAKSGRRPDSPARAAFAAVHIMSVLTR